MSITIEQDSLRSARFMINGVGDLYPKVTRRALTRTVKGVRKDMSSEIRAVYNLKKSYVDKSIKPFVNYSRLTGQVTVKSTPVGLINFTGTKQKPLGVSVKVKKASRRKTIPHTFIETMNNGTNVWWRKKDGWQRQPDDPRKQYGAMPDKYRGIPKKLERAAGPRLNDHISQPTVFKKLEEMAGDRLQNAVSYYTDLEMSKL